MIASTTEPGRLELSPRPGSATAAAMVARQSAMELRLLVRNGEQLLLTVAIPLLLLVVGTRADAVVDLGPGRTIDVITPGVLGLAVLSTSFTSVAIATGFERRYGVLKRLGASPLPRWGLLAGKVLAVLVTELVQLALLAGVAVGLGWRPDGGPGAVGWTLLVVLLATVAFGALGLLIAGTLRAEATLALANLAYVLLLVGGGLFVPRDRHPETVRPLIDVLPSGALGESLRETVTGAAPPASALTVLLVWALVAGALTARTFRWE